MFATDCSNDILSGNDTEKLHRATKDFSWWTLFGEWDGVEEKWKRMKKMTGEELQGC